MATLLQLLEQVAEPAGNHAARGSSAEHTPERAFQNVSKATTTKATTTAGAAGHATTGGCRRRSRGGRWGRTGLACGQMFEGLPGEQAEDRHGHGRHSAAGF